MGLDTTHNAWHGAYSSFMQWRKAIAEAAGFAPLELHEGFWPPYPHKAENMSAEKLPYSKSWARNCMIVGMYEQGRLPIKWENLLPECQDLRLVPLLSHSDCDGEIPPAECASIADALEALLPELKDEYMRTKTRQFIAGCRAAAAEGVPLGFH